MRSTTATVMAGAALALFACSKSGFNTPTLLNKVRVLAIQAEPPQPALGASTTLRALVYQPPPADGGDAGVTYSWSWCPLPMSPNDPSQCPIDQDAANQLFAGIPGVPTLDLGSGETATATFTNPFPAAMLASLCESKLDVIPALAAAAASRGGVAANGGLSFKCTIAGFPITVKLVVHTEAGDLPAVVDVYLPINDNIAANLNPVVGGISVTVDNADHQLDQAGTQGVLNNTGVPIILDMSESASEVLPDPNQVLPSPDPNSPYLPPNDKPYERLSMSWYAECGGFGGDGEGGRRTGYLGDPTDPNSQFATALKNTWNTPKFEDYPAYRARIIVVVRDSRGGVAWVSGVAHLGDTNSASDAGAPDSPEADGGEMALGLDAGVPDSPTAGGDAGALDSDQAGSADAPSETTP